MTTHHTPGPWYAEATTSSEFITRRVFGENGEKIADIGRPQISNLDVHTEVANARLIAAAPELLACLEAYALPALDYLSHKATSAADRKEFAARVETVRAVIAKAKGV